MATQQHRQASEQRLEQARAEFAAGDLAQAAERWCSAAQILRTVVEQCGSEHIRHRHHLVAVSRLSAETGDRDIRHLFAAASALDENFYENTMQAIEVAGSPEDVDAPMDKPLPLLEQT